MDITEHNGAFYPVQLLCRVLNLSRSSYYFALSEAERRQRRKQADEPLRQALVKLAAQWPT